VTTLLEGAMLLVFLVGLGLGLSVLALLFTDIHR
jgi:hypothetical protein